jgi:hypothetical protein
MESLGRSFNEGYGLDNISVAESSGRSLNQGHWLRAHLKSAMGAKLSVRSDLHMAILRTFSGHQFQPIVSALLHR